MRTLSIDYPDELPEALGKTPEEFEHDVRFLVAAKLYELGQVTSSWAARLMDMNRVAFLEQLGRYRISMLNYLPEELEQEIQEARARARNAS